MDDRTNIISGCMIVGCTYYNNGICEEEGDNCPYRKVDDKDIEIEGYKARIHELGNEIKQAYYEGWGDAIRETGGELFETDMQNNWLESDAIKAIEAVNK